MKLLTLCMIVKDEEAVIARCLDSIKNIAEEIIIVDTGSTDRTKEIASKYPQVSIYDFEWINDFSAARNAALNKATGKWILILDADEYLDTTESNSLKLFLQNEEPQPNVVFNMSIINYTGDSLAKGNILESSADRLFPNYMGIHYTRPIHEQLESVHKNTQLIYKRIPFRIFHTGYLAEVISGKDKHARNMGIFDAYKSTHGLDAYDHFTLGNEYQAMRDTEKALNHYRLAVKGASRNNAWYPHALVGLINSHIQLGQFSESWKLVENKLSFYNDYPDYHTIKGILYEAIGWFEQAEDCYKSAIDRAERLASKKGDFWLLSPNYGSEIPFSRLVNISFSQCRTGDGVFWLTKQLMNQPNDLASLIHLLETISQHEAMESILHLLTRLYGEPTKESTELRLLFLASLSIGHFELTSKFRSNLDSRVQFREGDQLRIFILENNRDDFSAFCQKMNSSAQDDYTVRQLLLGALIWNDTNFLKFAEAESAEATLPRLITKLIKEESLSNYQLTKHTHNLFLIAKDLYLMRFFDIYDSFVQQVQHPELINRLANYFFSRNQLELAINYYSLLYTRKELNAASCENLGRYYAIQNETEDAAEFLSMALEKEPERTYLYPALIACLHGVTQQQCIQKYKKEHPQHAFLLYSKKK